MVSYYTLFRETILACGAHLLIIEFIEFLRIFVLSLYVMNRTVCITARPSLLSIGYLADATKHDFFKIISFSIFSPRLSTVVVVGSSILGSFSVITFGFSLSFSDSPRKRSAHDLSARGARVCSPTATLNRSRERELSSRRRALLLHDEQDRGGGQLSPSKAPKKSCGSFSPISKPAFASKTCFCSIF